jgi:hypothetical protein
VPRARSAERGESREYYHPARPARTPSSSTDRATASTAQSTAPDPEASGSNGTAIKKTVAPCGELVARTPHITESLGTFVWPK